MEDKIKFKCLKCVEIFDNQNITIKHLKEIHFIREKIQPIECIVDGPHKCIKTYTTYRGLRSHISKCINVRIYSDINSK